jgi:hypothetical protein
VQNPKGTTALTPGNEMQMQWTGWVEDGSVIVRMSSSSASSFDAMFSLSAEAIPNEGALTIRIPSSATTSSDGADHVCVGPQEHWLERKVLHLAGRIVQQVWL